MRNSATSLGTNSGEHCLLSVFLLLLLTAATSSPCYAETRILDLGSNFQIVDMGYDNGMTYLVGSMDPGGGGDPVAMLTRSADLTSFTDDVLVGLGPDTVVLGVSSDGSRIAGVSKSPSSESIGEGTTWLSSAPESPVGIGFVNGFSQTSLAAGAWSGGVVGDHSGLQDAVMWTESTGLSVFADGVGLSGTRDVSADGIVAVGNASSIVLGGGPAYWDASGFHAFATPNGDQGLALSISPNATHVGGGY